MNGYNLTRNWFDFKFENVSKVRAIHSEFYFYLVDQWNRLGQKKEFGLPTSYTMECLGIGSYNTYKKVLNDLVEFGFVIIVKDSKNQHSAKIIALSKSDKATDKALDKATAIASDKASDKASDTIDKPINNKPINQLINTYEENFYDEDLSSDTKVLEKEERKKVALKKESQEYPDLDTFVSFARELYQNELKIDFSPFEFSVRSKYESWINAKWKDGNGKEIKNWKSKLKNTIPYLKPIYENGITNSTPQFSNTRAFTADKVSGRGNLNSPKIRPEFT